MDFPPAVERWRPYFAGRNLPVDYTLYWIQRESSGDPCNLTQSTGSDEVSLLQLMAPHDIATAGTDEATLRAGCPGPLTDDQIAAHIDASVNYLNALRGKAHDALDAVGAAWSESTPDFWALVKLFHAGPAYVMDETQQFGGGLPRALASLGRPPEGWSEFLPFTPNNHLTDVSWEFGQLAAGFSPSLSWIEILLVGATAVGAVFAGRYVSRRYIAHAP